MGLASLAQLHTLYYTLHTEHAYCLSYRFFNNVVITTIIEMVEMVEILDGRCGKRSVERVRYVINNLLHLVIVKYGVISLVLCISTRLRLVTILSLLMKYLVIFHAKPCNKSYIHHAKSRLNTPVWGSLCSPNYSTLLSTMLHHICQWVMDIWYTIIGFRKTNEASGPLTQT